MSREPIVNFNISCVDASDNSQDFSSRLPKQKSDPVHSAVERFKKESGVTGKGSYPVLATLTNFKSSAISDVAVTVRIYVKVRKDSAFESQPIVATLRHQQLGGNMHSDMILFDTAGFDMAVIQAVGMEYKEGAIQKVDEGFTQNTPFLIDMNEMQNAFGGFKDNDELETYFLLKNYSDHNLYLRGILLNMMYSDLEAINDGTYQLSGKKINYSEQQLKMVRALIQVDIIARIMMYIEDYVILLLANLSAEGNYYKLLDKHAKDDPDLGQRIQKFMEQLDSPTGAFTSEDYVKMLNYIDPALLDLTDQEREELKKRIAQNIVGVKSVLLLLRSFGRDHSQIFRRYKHAGFAVTFDVINKHPYTDTFDSHAMVLEGASPLHDVKSLPYSAKVLKAYSAIIRTLQEFISDAVRNKISGLERSSPGIVPFEIYTAEGMDEQLMSDILNKFWVKYPLRARNYHHTVKDVNAEKVSIEWYKQLDNFLAQCTKSPQSLTGL